MRLVDGDALDEFLFEAQKSCQQRGDNFRFGVLSNVRANIMNAPTIDAIPVEWLRKEEKEMLDNGVDANADVVDWLILTWQKEQEAR